jgi:hypothetical protein
MLISNLSSSVKESIHKFSLKSNRQFSRAAPAGLRQRAHCVAINIDRWYNIVTILMQKIGTPGLTYDLSCDMRM